MASLKEIYDEIYQLAEDRAQRKPYASNLALLEVAKNCQRQLTGDEPMVLTRCTFPQELIWSFGILPVYIEGVIAVIGRLMKAPDFLVEAESVGFSTDSCGWLRTVLGGVLTDSSLKPVLTIGSTDFCEDGMRFFEHASRHYDSEYILLEVPPDCSPESITYVEEQLRSIIAKLSQVSGRPFDQERLKELIRYSNQIRAIQLKIEKWKKQVPATLYGIREDDFFSKLRNGICGDIGWELAKKYDEEMDKKARQGPSSPEKIRLMWLYAIPPVPEIFPFLEGLGAHLVVSEASFVDWEEMDENEPVRALAKKICQSRTLGPIENRLEKILKATKDYQVDGAVHLSHFSCASSIGGIRIMKDELAKLGVSFLNLDGDCGVNQNNNPNQMRESLESFVERLVH
jgi:benzoyl-CoA reductase/2-hydroxyglutaryl-CoA dehydratase subunit BcrC/BadD/HgdB